MRGLFNWSCRGLLYLYLGTRDDAGPACVDGKNFRRNILLNTRAFSLNSAYPTSSLRRTGYTHRVTVLNARRSRHEQ
jgi:hypothetical protein